MPFTNRVHVSFPDGDEEIISYIEFREMLRSDADPQPEGDGGVKVISNVVILSFDDDDQLTIISNGIAYTPKDD